MNIDTILAGGFLGAMLQKVFVMVNRTLFHLRHIPFAVSANVEMDLLNITKW